VLSTSHLVLVTVPEFTPAMYEKDQQDRQHHHRGSSSSSTFVFVKFQFQLQLQIGTTTILKLTGRGH